MLTNGSIKWIMALIAILINFGGVVWFAAVVATNGATMQQDVAEIKTDLKEIGDKVIEHTATDKAWTDAHDKQHTIERKQIER